MRDISRQAARGREIARIVNDFVHYIWQTDPASVIWVLSLTVGRAALEGYGLFLLLPLLEGISGNGQGGVMGLPSPIAYLSFLCSCEINQQALLILFLALIILRSLIGYQRQVTIGTFHAKVLSQLRESYYDALGNAQWEYLVTRDPARFSQALTNQVDEAAYGVHSSASLASAILSLFIGVVVALVISFKLTLVVLAIGCVMALPLTAFDVYHYRLSGDALRAMTTLYHKLNQHLGSLKFFKLRTEGGPQSAFLRTSNAYSAAYSERMRVTAKTILLHEIGAATILAAVVLLGQGRAIDSVFVVLVIIFARLVPRVNEVHSSLRALLTIVPQYQDLTNELDRLRKHCEAVNGGQKSQPRLRTDLKFEAVSYRYPSRPELNAVSNLTFELKARSSLGIIGLSGAGKTTLADLAAGLLAPSKGRILVDGVELQGDHAIAWRLMVSYVLQDDPLIDDTVAANIRLGRSNASDSEIWEALRLVRSDALVRTLPDGLLTRVGDRGQHLSKGQRQRICLARSIISRPALLILDECTSGLNPIDEAEFGQLFSRLAKQTTIILISHRPAAMKWVDRVMVLDRGKIVELGSASRLRDNPRSLLRRMDLIEDGDVGAEANEHSLGW